MEASEHASQHKVDLTKIELGGYIVRQESEGLEPEPFDWSGKKSVSAFALTKSNPERCCSKAAAEEAVGIA